jgi:hypothetical protein
MWVESLHLSNDFPIKAAAHEGCDVSVSEKGNPIAVRVFRQVIDENLMTRDFEIVDIVKANARPLDVFRRQLANARKRGLWKSEHVNASQNPVRTDRSGDDHPSWKHGSGDDQKRRHDIKRPNRISRLPVAAEDDAIEDEKKNARVTEEGQDEEKRL